MPRLLTRWWPLLLIAVVMCAATSLSAKEPVARVLVFSGTGWYRHPDIAKTNGWLVRTLGEANFIVDVTETPQDLTPARLAEYDVLLLNNANELATLLKPEQLQAIEAWYAKGHAIVALHAALVHQTKWTWFYDLAGCDFDSDSEFSKAKIVVDPSSKDHPSVKGQDAEFWYQADWTNHDKSVTGLPGVKVLLRVDESTYVPVRPYFQERGGKAMGKDHPIAWLREHGGGRFFYTELGHDLRSLNTPFGEQHIVEGVRWAAGK
ncbi:MAG TPA: ThuA domain-containing protein [Pirellulaceae bacterium]|nr:ThuA domain-containing protein [Pirellulaceae bacterium]